MAHDSAISSLQVPECCRNKHSIGKPLSENTMEKAFFVAERLSAIALGVFAALTPPLFVPSFAFGVLLGLLGVGESVPNYSRAKSCSQGFLEQTTGIKLPDSLALASGFAVTAVHVDHHPEVFVPIVGISLGMWAGHTMRSSASLCYRKFAYRS